MPSYRVVFSCWRYSLSLLVFDHAFTTRKAVPEGSLYFAATSNTRFTFGYYQHVFFLQYRSQVFHRLLY